MGEECRVGRRAWEQQAGGGWGQPGVYRVEGWGGAHRLSKNLKVPTGFSSRKWPW